MTGKILKRGGGYLSRGKKQIEGQLSFDFCLDARNYVVQANTLIGGKQALKLNSAKLIRSAIMQVVGGDEELKPYIITVNELSELLNVPTSNIYRDIDDITDDIISNPVFVREIKEGRTIGFIKIPWVTKCEYKADVGVAIKLNEELRNHMNNNNSLYIDISNIYIEDGSYEGPLKLTFYVGEQYNGKYYSICHMKDYMYNFEEFNGIVENGKIEITVDSLSPFGISIFAAAVKANLLYLL